MDRRPLCSHLLKLLTGVETSTLPVKRSGSEGNRTHRRSRNRTAAPKTAACLRLTSIISPSLVMGEGHVWVRVLEIHRCFIIAAQF